MAPLLTENGWPQISASELDKGLLPGLTKQLETRKGDVTTILKGFAAWFDRNVEDIEFNYLPRDEWGWSGTNSVWNSNHLSGTAIDINATKYPMGRYVMPGWMVDKIREGLRLFEGTVFWGRDWTTPDEMHFQISGNAAQIAPFATRLREGYLGLWAPEKPADPDAFPLPLGYYYGPLDGPNESVSGDWSGDSQKAKDGLGRWQAAVGVPVTKRWDDATKRAAQVLQMQNKWQPAPGNGFVYEGEWNVVVKHGQRPDLSTPVPEPSVYDVRPVRWNDVSQFQSKEVDHNYPYRVFCFRVASGAVLDTLAAKNYANAKYLADQGKIDLIIAYSFWRPNVGTWDAMESFIQSQGGKHDKLAIMLDVEDGQGSSQGRVSGDQTAGANDYIDRAIKFLWNNPKRVCGYQNFVTNSDLWGQRRADLKMIIPNYSLPVGQRPNGPQFFAHQYTDKAASPSWPGRGVDENYFGGTLGEFLTAFNAYPGGLDPVSETPPVVQEPEAETPEPQPGTGSGSTPPVLVELKKGESVRIVAI